MDYDKPMVCFIDMEMDYWSQQMLERCKKCNGAKKITGLGMLQEVCPKCKGTAVTTKESKPDTVEDLKRQLAAAQAIEDRRMVTSLEPEAKEPKPNQEKEATESAVNTDMESTNDGKEDTKTKTESRKEAKPKEKSKRKR